MSPAPTRRLGSIDETRAMAIISMMIMHFGPGVFDRVPALAGLAEPVLFLGRFATTTFVLVFGLTVGFVHYERYQGPRRAEVLAALYARARLLFLCAFIICVPNHINLLLAGERQLSPWLFNTYSILNYYALALLSVPLWLRWLGKTPLRNALLVGGAHWALGAALLTVWPLDPALGVQEYLRLHLISGPYAYLQLSGSAIMVIPVGIALRRALREQRIEALLLRLLPLALLLTLAGWLIGRWYGEFSLAAIVAGTVKTPPRLWYWLFFAGPALLALSAFTVLGLRGGELVRQLLYPLALFGQASLPIYTAHTFVLPSLNWLDHWIVVEGLGRILLPFVLFGLYCLAMMWRYHHRRAVV